MEKGVGSCSNMVSCCHVVLLFQLPIYTFTEACCLVSSKSPCTSSHITLMSTLAHTARHSQALLHIVCQRASEVNGPEC